MKYCKRTLLYWTKFEWNKCTKNNIKKCSLSQWTKVIKGDLINILKRFNKDNHQYIKKKYEIN